MSVSATGAGVHGGTRGASAAPAALAAALAARGARPRPDEPLARHTSFRIGGPADLLVVVESGRELADVLGVCHAHGAPVLFLGGGTNLLVSDRGVRGVVVKLGKSFDFVEWDLDDLDVRGARLRVGAAVPLKRLVHQTVAAGLAGLEFAEGIPGTVGGGLLMNAGAFGGEIGAVVGALEVVTAEGAVRTLARTELAFDYRRLTLPTRAIVAAVRLQLRRGEPATLAAAVADARGRRERHQPRGYPNAGSIFKNPSGEHAGRLIEAAGLKGARLGGAMISERHANFIVNLGGARAADVAGLMGLAGRAVRERFGVALEPEIRLVGEW